MSNNIKSEIAARLIQSSYGRFFSAEFFKKNGDFRQMTCRIGVKKHLKGGKKPYSFSENDLVSVWDTKTRAYRSIPLDSLVSLTVDGQKFTVV
jgi:hypothetical protein